MEDYLKKDNLKTIEFKADVVTLVIYITMLFDLAGIKRNKEIMTALRLLARMIEKNPDPKKDAVNKGFSEEELNTELDFIMADQ